MSDKPKKPFLKKGTRQFLSNAQVRSQLDKPKIVDFGESEEMTENVREQSRQPYRQPPRPPVRQSVDNKSKPVKVDRATPKPSQQKSICQPQRKIEELRNRVRADEQEDMVFVSRNNKPKKQNFLNDDMQKEQSRDEYRGSQRKAQSNLDFYLNKKKKNTFTNEVEPQPPSSHKKPAKKYVFEDQQQEQDFQANYRGKPQNKREDFQVAVDADKFSQEEQPNDQKSQYNFDDDAVWEKNKDGVMKRSILKKQAKNKLYDEEPVEQQPKKSKLVEKFLYGDTKNSRQMENRRTEVAKPITIQNVPEEIKLKIIEQSVNKMKQRLQEEVDRVKAEGDAVKRVKNKYQEQMRQLQKAKKQFEKQMEMKKQEFEEYMKEERAKIQKDKKVIKDGLENRYTRKEKQEIQDIRKEMEEAKEEKKKSESRMRVEIDRLKKKLDDEVAKNKTLQQEIRILQLGRIQMKTAVNSRPDPQPAPPKQAKPRQLTNDHDIQLMKSNTFCLSDLPLQSYLHTANAFYKDYCLQRPEEEQLQSQKQQSHQVKRIYKSGRVETERYMKFVKEVFPNGYEIVHHSNTDIKQKLPGGQQIYYDSMNQAVEFTIEKQQKIIVFFFKESQAEMRIKMDHGWYRQAYNGNSLMKTFPDGRTQTIDANGHKVTRGNTKVVNGKENTITYPRTFKNF